MITKRVPQQAAYKKNLEEKDASRGLFERLIIRLIQSLEACRLRNSPGHIPYSPGELYSLTFKKRKK